MDRSHAAVLAPSPVFSDRDDDDRYARIHHVRLDERTHSHVVERDRRYLTKVSLAKDRAVSILELDDQRSGSLEWVHA